ncbi:asparagine synthase (glutamine-hydrolyzing) [Methanoculleus sp. Wushi-C6]|uniref:Putative asparagine synthetase [glutamine-hydrolyzing] n=1 Tax=Methanoculleus caldifontis TaxID=2651577 RepID=A0ABU3X3G5_9EURY|nr:asparagine synthase (glutamine-hydrolyzing) [Methanoculleus sp. Wushi-C6]MDV2482607.1 asparagine synthase (glutamine-hydrolyzing) [Methanoculleus sp. Wushi-C6]
MCGIAALVMLGGLPEQLRHITVMTDILRHRGPDDEGSVFFGQNPREISIFGGEDTPLAVYGSDLAYAPQHPTPGGLPERAVLALGHRRLSIIDPTPAGHQPMCSPDRRYWIVYNGEIYNYRELRLELEAYGHRFASSTDTEVLLAAYAHWGRDCLHRLNGMWAFVIYDTQEQKVFVARDRFGVKPLYYWFSPEGFLAMASEIKAFTVLPGWNPHVNGPRVYDYLVSNLLDHTSETLFAGVYQLRGGEAAEFRVGEIDTALPVYRWYRLDPHQFSGTFDEAVTEFGRLLRDSVRLRLRSDVPGGSCLSGGLDSSSIVCLANDLLREEQKEGFQKTFSACSDVKEYDEREYADEVISARGIEAHYTYPSFEELLEELDELVWYQDEPFKTTSIYAQWLVFELAANHGVKVLLDGQGADEQLCGYQWFFGCRYADHFHSMKWKMLWRDIRAVKSRHGLSEFQSLSMMGYYLLPSSVREIMKPYATSGQAGSSWLNTGLLSAYNAAASGAERSFAARSGPSLTTTQSIALDQMLWVSLPSLLHWEDRNSMAHSVESRVPFLDYRLVEYVMSLPEEYRIHEGVTKRILREAMSGILPERVRMRMDKMGFYTAEEHWLRYEDPEIFRRLLVEAVQDSKGILTKEVLGKLERMFTGDDPVSAMVWRWILFGRWMRIFNVQTPNAGVGLAGVSGVQGGLT